MSPRKPSRAKIFAAFMAGASVQSLAEKYGMDRLEIESIIRFQGRKP